MKIRSILKITTALAGVTILAACGQNDYVPEIYPYYIEQTGNENTESDYIIEPKPYEPPAEAYESNPYESSTTDYAYESYEPETATERELARFSTRFDNADQGRNHNIALAASCINNKTINPGETFSYNETLGPTIKSRGYKKGMIFDGGKKSKGYGGGVCQVSSTLYNAVASAELEITERHEHSRGVTYVEAGKDAATSYGVIDFKFKNNKPFPVMIQAEAANGAVSVAIKAV